MANLASAQEERISFDIPAQPLTKALHMFSASTGIEILVDARNAAGRHSPGVEGSMATREALDILLVESNLVAQEFGLGTVTLRPSPALTAHTSGGRGNLPYFVDIQRAVQQALCRDDRTSPGDYRLALKLWIGRSGTVIRSKRLDTTGDEHLDSALDAVMQRVSIGKPLPPDLPQPITLVISPSRTQGAVDCMPRAQNVRRASSR